MSVLRDRIKSLSSLLLLLLLACSLPALSQNAKSNELHLSLSLTRGERSRDSSASTTLIVIEGDKLVYDQTFSGRQPRGRQPIHQEYKLTAEELRRLRQIIEANKLLKSNSLAYPQIAGVYRYFEINLKLRLDRRESSITISGPAPSAKLKEERLYRSASALAREVYGLINARDGEISYEELAD